MSWTGFKKGVSRASTSLMQKTGAIDKTTDKEFEDEEKRYRQLESNMTRLHKEAKAYLDSIRAMTVCQQRIAEHINVLYDENGQYCYAGHLFKSATDRIDSECRVPLDNNYRECVLEPLTRFVHHFGEINDVIKKRSRKCLDYDAAKASVKRAVERPSEDSSKLPRVEQELALAKQAYDVLNDALIEDLPKLVAMRIAYLEPALDAFMESQCKFFEDSLNELKKVTETVNKVGLETTDPQAVMNEIKRLTIVSPIA